MLACPRLPCKFRMTNRPALQTNDHIRSIKADVPGCLQCLRQVPRSQSQRLIYDHSFPSCYCVTLSLAKCRCCIISRRISSVAANMPSVLIPEDDAGLP